MSSPLPTSRGTAVAHSAKFRFSFSAAADRHQPTVESLVTAIIPVKFAAASTMKLRDLCEEFRTRGSKRFNGLETREVDALVCNDSENGGTFTLDLLVNGDDTLDCYFPLEAPIIHDVVVKWRSFAAPKMAVVEVSTDAVTTRHDSPALGARRYVPTKPQLRLDDDDGGNGGRPPRSRPHNRVGSAPATITRETRVDDGTTVVLTFPSPLRRAAPTPSTEDDDDDEEQSPAHWLHRQLALLSSTEEEDREGIVLECVTALRFFRRAMDDASARQAADESRFSQPRTPSSSPGGVLTGASHRKLLTEVATATPPQASAGHGDEALEQVRCDWLSVRFKILSEERKVRRVLVQAADSHTKELRDRQKRTDNSNAVAALKQKLSASATNQHSSSGLVDPLALHAMSVLEQSERVRLLVDAEVHEWTKLTEECWLEAKRIALKHEQALINAEKQLQAHERDARAALEQLCFRKFALFTTLCEKGRGRINHVVIA